MPRRQLFPHDLQEIRIFAAQGAQSSPTAPFGGDGPGTEVDFQAMEDVARAAAGVCEGTAASPAPRRAFLGAGQAYKGTIHKGYFPDFEPIVDFLHVLCYVYLAAWAVGSGGGGLVVVPGLAAGVLAGPGGRGSSRRPLECVARHRFLSFASAAQAKEKEETSEEKRCRAPHSKGRRHPGPAFSLKPPKCNAVPHFAQSTGEGPVSSPPFFDGFLEPSRRI